MARAATPVLWTRRRWLRAAAAFPVAGRLQTPGLPTVVVTGGELVLQGRLRRADLLIRGETILAIGGPFRAPETIDASGLWVLPGGVDPHVHAQTGWRHTAMRSFAELSAEALRGGTTTLVDFIVQQPGESLSGALERKRRLAGAGCLADYAFHILITDPAAALPGIGPAVADGVRSFKLFMASPKALDRRQILEIMAEVARAGGQVSVHAEDGAAIEALETAVAAGRALVPADLPATRPPSTEVSAVRQALDLAAETGVRLHLHHLSTRGALAEVEAARRRGQSVSTETCPHYLVLDDSVYAADEAWRFVVYPPLRGASEIESLWAGIRAGTVDMLVSDDACFPVEQKRLGAGSMAMAPPGGCGAAARIRLAVGRGHFDRGLPLIHIAQLVATAPARAFGLAPRKGALQVGADADIVLIDPGREAPLRPGVSPYSMFDSEPLKGDVVLTLRRGRIVARAGRLVDDPGPGVEI